MTYGIYYSFVKDLFQFMVWSYFLKIVKDRSKTCGTFSM